MNIDAHTLKTTIDKHFPYENYNPGQYEAIEQSVKSILKGTQHTILSCPTGVGKSVIAITAHNVLNELRQRHGSTTTAILATTKGLQDQYNKDFPDLIDLKGKSNYFCFHNISEGYNSPKCIEKLKSKQCAKEKCQYVITRDAWSAKKAAKTTNSSMMIASKNLIPVHEPLDLMIIDECHEIDKVIINQSVLKFNINDYPESTSYYTDFLLLYNKIISLIKSSYPTEGAFNLNDRLEGMKLEELKGFYNNVAKLIRQVTSSIEMAPNDYKWVIIKNELEDLQEKLDYFVNPLYETMEWVFDIEHDDRMNEFLLLKPIKSNGVLSRTKLFSKSECYLHMSATVGGIETYCDNLGISDYEYIEIDNPIEVKRRQVILTNLNALNRNTPTNIIINSIVPIIKSESGNGIIHTVSFKLANDIYYNVPFDIKKRMIVSNNREEIMDFLKRKSNGIVLSPSVETGYDFKGDLARWQIIAKVPFLNLGDNYTKTRLNKSGQWYAREAVLRVVQACGRIVRGLDDYGTTYIIDENILRLISDNSDMFPEWWIEALDMID